MGAQLPFGGKGAGSSFETLWPGTRPTCMPSFKFIHPTVWPQYTNVRDRRDKQRDRQRDNGLIAESEPFYKRSPKNWLQKHARGTSPGESCVDYRVAGDPRRPVFDYPGELSSTYWRTLLNADLLEKRYSSDIDVLQMEYQITLIVVASQDFLCLSWECLDFNLFCMFMFMSL